MLGRHTRADAEPETDEEKFQVQNYVLKQEQKNFQLKYDRVVDKNRRWSDKDEKPKRQYPHRKPKLLASNQGTQNHCKS